MEMKTGLDDFPWFSAWKKVSNKFIEKLLIGSSFIVGPWITYTAVFVSSM